MWKKWWPVIDKWVRRHWPELTIATVWFVIIVCNLLPAGSWLMGYDHLSPELNLPLALERVRYPVWQDYRGLGVADSVMDGVELTRLPFVWLVSLTLGARWVRFAWLAVMLLVGPLGVYYLLRQWLDLIFLGPRPRPPPYLQSWAALVGALFYLLNPAMVQFFYAPLETFASFYGFLPLIIWRFTSYLRDARWSNLLILILISLAGSSAFYVQTFFVVLLMVLAVVALGACLRRRLVWTYVRRSLVGALAVVIANAFWFLPLLPVTLGHSNDVLTSKQNLISTPQVQEMNYLFGRLRDVSVFNSYWSEYTEYRYTTNDYHPYLGVWQEFWRRPGVRGVGWTLFGLGVVGYVWTGWTGRRRTLLAGTALVWLLAILMLTAGRGTLLGWPYRLLTSIKIFNQIFRVAVTKWSTVASLMYGWGLSLFIYNIGLYSRRFSRWHLISITTGAVIALASGLTVAPLVRGHWFGWQVQPELPEAYWQLRDFMATQDQTALVAYLPMPSFWGWLFYDWGYRGSGFLWQMIAQPLLDRNFDVWSVDNQTAYQQLHLAIERSDVQLLQEVVRKYGIKMAILDEKIINSYVENQLVQLRANSEIENLLQQAGGSLIWSQDGLKVYDLSILADQKLIRLLTNYQTVGNDRLTSINDIIYGTEGDYILTSEAQVYYPFAAALAEAVATVSCDDEYCTLEEQSARSTAGQTIHLPYWRAGEAITVNGWAWFSGEDQLDLDFGTGLELLVGEDSYAIPELAGSRLSGINAGRVILDFGDHKPHLLERGEVIHFSVELTVGEPVSVQVIDASQISDIYHDLQIPLAWVQQFDLPAETWTAVTTPTTITLDQAAPLRVRWQATSMDLDIAALTTAQNCDVLGRGQVAKLLTDGLANYTADYYATVCEGYSLEDLSSLNDYLIQFEVVNQAGQPLQFFVTNNSTRKLLSEQVLDKTSTSQYFYIPRLQTVFNQHSQLSFHLNNKSYGLTSQNEVRRIRFIEYPIAYLSRVKVTTDQASPPATDQRFRLTRAVRHHPANYEIQLTTDAETTGQRRRPAVLTLERAYNKAWVAWGQTDRGWRPLPHVVVNSWANGWQLPTDRRLTRVVIFFWPQYLMTVGLLLLAATLVGMVIYYQIWPRGRRRTLWPSVFTGGPPSGAPPPQNFRRLQLSRPPSV